MDDMEAYQQLTDAVYHQILGSTDTNLNKAKEILDRIETRKLYKCVGQTQPTQEDIDRVCLC